MLEKLLPAAIGSNVPAEPAARAAAIRAAVQSRDQLLYDTSPAIRAAFLPLLDLLDLLTMGISRGPLFGVWKSWKDASDAGFMRGAYSAFATLATMCWYLEPAHGASSGYPGPPSKVVIAS